MQRFLDRRRVRGRGGSADRPRGDVGPAAPVLRAVRRPGCSANVGSDGVYFPEPRGVHYALALGSALVKLGCISMPASLPEARPHSASSAPAFE